MKKVIYISSIVLGLGFVSCQKQEVSPTSQEMEAPVWQDAPDSDENARNSNSNLNFRGDSPEDTGVPIDPNGDGSGSIKDGVITDPNKDPDAD